MAELESRRDSVRDRSKMDKSTSNKAVFADGTRFKGHIKNTRAIEINGTVEADLKADKVTIGSDGKFVGSITADLIVVSGHYDGNMDAGSIWATATAQITGKIQYKTLQMDRGAALNCRVVHNWKPEKAKAKKTTSKDAAVVEADRDVNPKTTDGSVANVVAEDGDDTSQFAPGSDSTNKKRSNSRSFADSPEQSREEKHKPARGRRLGIFRFGSKPAKLPDTPV